MNKKENKIAKVAAKLAKSEIKASDDARNKKAMKAMVRIQTSGVLGNQQRCTVAAAKYIGTLVDPWKVKNVRIPDQLTYPSATVPLLFKTTITPVADISGTLWAAGIALAPEVLFQNGGIQGGIFPLATPTGVAPPGNWFYDTRPTSVKTFPQQAALVPVTSTFRVVSAGLSAWTSASMMNNQGWCTSFALNCGFTPDIPQLFQPGTGVSVNDIQSQAYANKKPMQQTSQGPCICSVNYWPDSTSQYEYKSTYTNILGETNSPRMSLLGLFIGGLPSGMTTPNVPIEVTIILNIEYRVDPIFTAIVSTKASKYCVLAMEAALNVAPSSRRFNTPSRDIINTTTADEGDGDGSDEWFGDYEKGIGYLKTAWKVAKPFLSSYGPLDVNSLIGNSGFMNSTPLLPYHH